MIELRSLLDSLPKNRWLLTVKKNELFVNWLNATYTTCSTGSLAERIYLFDNNLLSPPKCAHPNCNNLVKWTNNNHYPNCCSKKCANSLNVLNGIHAESLKKQKETMIKKYGVDNPAKSAIFQEKKKQTNISRYGVDNPQKSDIIRNKTAQTNFKKYGYVNPLCATEIKEKAKKTLLNNYGVANPSQSPIIQNTIKQNNIAKYGVPIANAAHMTVDSFNQINDPVWLANAISTTTIQDIAVQSNVNISTIYKKISEFSLKEPTGLPHSQPEFQLIDFIKSLGFNDVIHGDRTIIFPKEIDIVIPSAKLAIEYCGLFWHSEFYKDINYHKNKMVAVNNAGYQLLTIFEDEYLTSSKLIEKMIQHKLGKSTDKIFARNTNVVEVFDTNAIKNFYDNNHVQHWDKGSSITCALTHNNEYVAMMSFEKNKNNSMYLTRFATSCHVLGGASKLFKYFLISYPNITEIISFADLRWSDGNLYNKLGFKLLKTLEPDYRYIVRGERRHKFNYRKVQLKKLFGNELDTDNMTEKEIMLAMNIPRIWDCGKLKFVYNR